MDKGLTCPKTFTKEILEMPEKKTYMLSHSSLEDTVDTPRCLATWELSKPIGFSNVIIKSPGT